MTDDEIYAELTSIFREVFGNEGIELNPQSTADTIVGWDSFKFVEVIIAIESRFGIELKASEIDAIEKVGDLASMIRRSG